MESLSHSENIIMFLMMTVILVFARVLGELAQRVAYLRFQEFVRGELQRVGHRLVFDEVPEKCVAVLPNRCFQRDRMP